jgi:hypothetical protein
VIEATELKKASPAHRGLTQLILCTLSWSYAYTLFGGLMFGKRFRLALWERSIFFI